MGGQARAGPISIHAPSRERQLSSPPDCSCCRFQSTLPHGSDPDALAVMMLHSAISIHAPSRERLARNCTFKTFTSDFNPRSLTGATDALEALNTVSLISIHAPSRERPVEKVKVVRRIEFQSTLPHGSDTKHPPADVGGPISIHAPSRERQAVFGSYLQKY